MNRLLDVEVYVLERSVVGALFLELEVSAEGEEDEVAELEVGRELSMAVVLRVVVLLQSEGGLIVLRVLGFRVKVDLEVEHEGVEERRVEASGAVQVRDEGEELLQHREEDRELVSFLFAFKSDVAGDFFFGFGAPGQLLVLGLQLGEVSDFVFDRGEAVYGHFGFLVVFQQQLQCSVFSSSFSVVGVWTGTGECWRGTPGFVTAIGAVQRRLAGAQASRGDRI